MKDIEGFCPDGRQDWRNWLILNHQKNEAVWLIFYKKKSPKFNLTWSDAVDEALCFGWIDSVKKTIDGEKYKQYFSKRKTKSNWSKINKDKVEALIRRGLMQEEGYKSIAIAKTNDSWARLDKIEALIIPEDLNKEFENYESSKEYYDSLSKSVKKMLLYWVISAKRKETRHDRILQIVTNASKGMKPKQFRK